MKRLRRMIYNSLTAMSLLLCLGMAGLWVRSYSRDDQFSRIQMWMGGDPRGDEGRFFSLHLVSSRGRLSGERVHGYTIPGYEPFCPLQWKWFRLPPGSRSEVYPDTVWGRRGLLLIRHPPGKSHADNLTSELIFGVPHWLPTLLFSLLPLHRLIKILRRSRCFAAGLCPVCGYDLRATPARCPECGTVNQPGSGERPR
jgi:hypothetical protein